MQVQQIQEDLVALLTLQNNAECLGATLDTICSQYTSSLQATDFEQELPQLLQESLTCKQ